MLTGLESGYVKTPSDKTARQLATAAPDLEHPISAPEPGELTCTVDELVGIARTAAVILSRHLVEHHAVAPCRSSICHAPQPRECPGQESFA